MRNAEQVNATINNMATTIGSKFQKTTVDLGKGFQQVTKDSTQLTGALQRLGTSYKDALNNVSTSSSKAAATSTQFMQSLQKTTVETNKLATASVNASSKLGRIADVFNQNRATIFGLTGMVTAGIEAVGMFSMLGDAQKKLATAQAELNELQQAGLQGTKDYTDAEQNLAEAQRGFNFVMRNTLLSFTDLIPFTLLFTNALLKQKAEVTANVGAISHLTSTTKTFSAANAVANTTLATTKPAADAAALGIRGLSLAMKSLLVSTGVGIAVVAVGLLVEAYLNAAEKTRQIQEGIQQNNAILASNVANTQDKITNMFSAYAAYQLKHKDTVVSSLKEIDEAITAHSLAEAEAAKKSLEAQKLVIDGQLRFTQNAKEMFSKEKGVAGTDWEHILDPNWKQNKISSFNIEIDRLTTLSEGLGNQIKLTSESIQYMTPKVNALNNTLKIQSDTTLLGAESMRRYNSDLKIASFLVDEFFQANQNNLTSLEQTERLWDIFKDIKWQGKGTMVSQMADDLAKAKFDELFPEVEKSAKAFDKLFVTLDDGEVVTKKYAAAMQKLGESLNSSFMLGVSAFEGKEPELEKMLKKDIDRLSHFGKAGKGLEIKAKLAFDYERDITTVFNRISNLMGVFFKVNPVTMQLEPRFEMNDAKVDDLVRVFLEIFDKQLSEDEKKLAEPFIKTLEIAMKSPTTANELTKLFTQNPIFLNAFSKALGLTPEQIKDITDKNADVIVSTQQESLKTKFSDAIKNDPTGLLSGWIDAGWTDGKGKGKGENKDPKISEQTDAQEKLKTAIDNTATALGTLNSKFTELTPLIESANSEESGIPKLTSNLSSLNDEFSTSNSEDTGVPALKTNLDDLVTSTDNESKALVVLVAVENAAIKVNSAYAKTVVNLSKDVDKLTKSINTMVKSMNSIPKKINTDFHFSVSGTAPKGQVKLESLAEGGILMTNGRQLIMVGDNPSGKEMIVAIPQEKLGGGRMPTLSGGTKSPLRDILHGNSSGIGGMQLVQHIHIGDEVITKVVEARMGKNIQTIIRG